MAEDHTMTMGGDHCAVRPGRKRSAVFAALLCAHCSLTIGAAVLTAGLAVVPPIFGVPADRLIVPLFISGLFALWLLWGATAPTAQEA